MVSVSPLGKDVATILGHLSAIENRRRPRNGINPIGAMTRVHLMTNGIRRPKVPVARKLPFTAEDLMGLKCHLDLANVDRLILRRTVRIGRFYMQRTGGYFTTDPLDISIERRPVSVAGPATLTKGWKMNGGPEVDEVPLRISGSETDYPNHRCIRSRPHVTDGSPNAHLCVVRSLVNPHDRFPAMFNKDVCRPFATWRNGAVIPSTHATSILRSAAFKQGNNVHLFSLHSIRAGEATALYRETNDIELVAQFGRWRTESIAVYLWGSYQMYTGMGALMAVGGTLAPWAIQMTQWVQNQKGDRGGLR